MSFTSKPFCFLAPKTPLARFSQLFSPQSSSSTIWLSTKPVSSFASLLSAISKNHIAMFLRKSLPLANTNSLCFLRCFSTSSDRDISFTVSYLVNSLGFSPEAALSASKDVKFDSPEKPDKAVEFFEGYGFTRTQTSKLIRGCPRLLLLNPVKIYFPKLEFLRSKGISRPDLAKVLSNFPTVLRKSLEKQIMPAYDFLRDFFQCDETAVKTFRRFPDILCRKVETCVVPNIAILREYGVSQSNIAWMIKTQPRAFMILPNHFRKVVERVAKMGFDASMNKFADAVSVLRQITEPTWENKARAYKKWGWSDEEIQSAFESYPRCMMFSEGKIMESMDVFVNRIGLTPSYMAKHPVYLAYSLKKRVIPRLLVFEALLSKCLVGKEVKIGNLLFHPEDKFLQMFVEPYPEEAPYLMKLYKDNLAASNS